MSNNIQGIVVCVGYDDLLTLTLPRALQHLSSCIVVSSPEDFKTHELVQKTPRCQLFVTDAFKRHGASFNKGLALEEVFQRIPKDQWILVWDADIVFPLDKSIPKSLNIGTLYSARRRVLKNPVGWNMGADWNSIPIHNDRLFPGYFHLFHGFDPVLQTQPWYDVTFSHAGGGDGYFQSRWNVENKIRFDWQVVHLGPIDTNWHGRITERVDGLALPPESQESRKLQTTYLNYKGWIRPTKSVTQFDEHVVVPGFDSTGFKVGSK